MFLIKLIFVLMPLLIQRAFKKKELIKIDLFKFAFCIILIVFRFDQLLSLS